MSGALSATDDALLDEAERREGVRAHDHASGIGRLFGFSDGVFAIAITLLVLDLRVPDVIGAFNPGTLNQEVIELVPVFTSFVISFFVIGLYWTIHHRIYRVIWRYDGMLVWINLLFLFTIALLPFPTSLLGRHSDQSALVIGMYAVNCAAVGLAAFALVAWAEFRNLVVVKDEKRLRRGAFLNLVPPAIFISSLALLPFSLDAAMYSWLAIPITLFAGSRLLQLQDQGD